MIRSDSQPDRQRRRVRRVLTVGVPLLVLAAAVLAATLATGNASAVPSNGQPCTCHAATTAPTVTVTPAAGSILKGKTLKVRGKVVPGLSGLKAKLQVKKSAGAWKTYKTLTLSATSTVATTWKASVKGTFRFRLFYLGDNQYAAGASAAKVVKVK